MLLVCFVNSPVLMNYMGEGWYTVQYSYLSSRLWLLECAMPTVWKVFLKKIICSFQKNNQSWKEQIILLRNTFQTVGIAHSSSHRFFAWQKTAWYHVPPLSHVIHRHMHILMYFHECQRGFGSTPFNPQATEAGLRMHIQPSCIAGALEFRSLKMRIPSLNLSTLYYRLFQDRTNGYPSHKLIIMVSTHHN